MFYYDAVGRLVVLDINLYGCSYRFINVYAPNNHAEHLVYWGDKILILGGDISCIDNTSIGKVGGNDVYVDVGEYTE